MSDTPSTPPTGGLPTARSATDSLPGEAGFTEAAADLAGPTSTMVAVERGPRISRVWWVTGPALLAVVALIVTLMIRPVPYIVLMPGDATEVQPLITVEPVDGRRPYVDQGRHDILFVTVSIRFPRGIEALLRTFDDRNAVVPSKPYLGTQSTKENRTFNLSLMTDSKDRATKVALERVGYEVKVTATGAVIIDLDPSFPAAPLLQPGDTIVAADGKKVTSADELADAIQAHRPGERIELVLERLGRSGKVTVDAPLVEHKEKKGVAQLGVSLRDRPRYDFPVKVSIDSGDVGGPSAGLAFTLALIDVLSPGKLTGGKRVAVTGTIELDGSVGPVGGVRQKTEAAIEQGAVLFLVPSDEYAEAVEAARGRLKVKKVDQLDQALSALEELGGEPVTEPAE